VPELLWWKHAAGCHGAGHIAGETGWFVEDAVHARIVAFQAERDAEVAAAADEEEEEEEEEE
jgi:hypothetical protein